jgi:hypothetical protein
VYDNGMSWLDDRLAEETALRSRHAAITAEATKVYDALWEQIMEFIEEGRKKSINLLTNASPYERIVRSPVMPLSRESGHAAKELRLKLAKEKTSIVVSGAVRLQFDLDVGADGVVCLKIGSEPVSIERAAVKVLDPFIFPDLPRKY